MDAAPVCAACHTPLQRGVNLGNIHLRFSGQMRGNGIKGFGLVLVQ